MSVFPLAKLSIFLKNYAHFGVFTGSSDGHRMPGASGDTREVEIYIVSRIFKRNQVNRKHEASIQETNRNAKIKSLK